jgi:hypothetical protein
MTSHAIGTLKEHVVARSDPLDRTLRGRDGTRLPTAITRLRPTMNRGTRS